MNDTSKSDQLQDTRAEWWFECDEGWGPLIAELEGRLRDLSPDFTIGQVKEKFGGLRFYANAGDVGEAISRQFYALIREAEARSQEICERCGRPGQLSRRATYGWYKTVCSTCAGKFGMEPAGNSDDDAG